MATPAAGTTSSVGPPGAPMNAPSIERWSIASRAAASSANGTSSKPTCFATAAARGAGPTTPTWRSRGFGECKRTDVRADKGRLHEDDDEQREPEQLVPAQSGAGSAPGRVGGRIAHIRAVGTHSGSSQSVRVRSASRSHTWIDSGLNRRDRTIVHHVGDEKSQREEHEAERGKYRKKLCPLARQPEPARRQSRSR